MLLSKSIFARHAALYSAVQHPLNLQAPNATALNKQQQPLAAAGVDVQHTTASLPLLRSGQQLCGCMRVAALFHKIVMAACAGVL